MIKAQKIINETKLTNVPGLDVGKFHEMVKPALYACEREGKSPLDVSPMVIKNHLDPQDVAFNATVMNYLSTHAAISTVEEQYFVLLDEMDNLVNLCDSCADWKKGEMPRGAYMAGSRLNQKKTKTNVHVISARSLATFVQTARTLKKSPRERLIGKRRMKRSGIT